jgi:DNA-binding transcriptional LysR family regulator
VDKVERVERRLKLHDVRILMSVVQAGGMRKAAAQLGTSQPAISRSISDLEHALGVRLLDRGSRGIEPTPYGRALIKRGVAVFDELRQGVRDIEFLADPTSGELRIGCSESFAAGPVLAVIDRLTRRHPRIVLHVLTTAGPPLYRDLRERNVEIAISLVTGGEAVADVAVEDLFVDNYFVVVAGSQSPWAHRRKIELAELVNEAWTLLPSESVASAVFVEAFRARGLEPPRTTVITPSLNLRNALLATGRFLTVLPRFALMLRGKHPSLKALPVEFPNASRNIAILTLRNRTLSPLAEIFIETIRAIVKPMVNRR